MKAELEEMGKSPAKLPGPRNTIGQTVMQNVASTMQMLPRTSIRATAITDAIASFLARDLHSIGVAAGEGFVHLLNVLEPRYEPLESNALLDVLQVKKQAISNLLLEKLSETEACALTTDCWSADNGRLYCTLMVRFIDGDWELRNFVLRTLEITPDQNHGNHIWDINKVLADWTLMPRIVYHQSMETQTGSEDGSEATLEANPVITVEVSQMKVIAGVTNDNGNVALALKHLGMTSLPCFANAFNGAVSAGVGATKAPIVNELIGKARKLVSHFVRSAKDRFILSKKTLEMNCTEGNSIVDLINDVQNRWTTTAEMIGRLLELKGPLNAILMVHKERSVRELGLTAEEWYQLEELHSAMKAVSMAIGILGGDEYASCSMVAPLMHRLKEKFMKITEHDTPAVFQYKKVVWEHLNPHYNESEIQSLFNICAFFDPRFKDLVHLTDVEREEVLQGVRHMVMEIEESQHGLLGVSTQDDCGDTPPAKRRQRLQELDLLFGTIEDKDRHTNLETPGSDLDRYLQEAPIGIKESPLDWWKRNYHRYPTVAKLARRHLCVPATAVPSECILSQDGSPFYNRRQRLMAEEIDNMVFLNKNFDLTT